MRSTRNNLGLSLVELMVGIAGATILMLASWSLWALSAKQLSESRSVSDAQKNAFQTLRRIEQEVMRASVIQVPDPNYAALASMQLRIPSGTSTVRRAFRLSGDDLIVDLKDEGSTYAAFEGLSSLSFAILDPPANTTVRITCASTVGGKTVQMQTVAYKRN